MAGDREAPLFFDAIARRYDRVYALSGEESKARIAHVCFLIREKKRVLVLGVGTGRELSALQDAGHVVNGIDCSPEMIALCNRRARPIPIALGDFWEPLPFERGSVDAVVALHGTLAHPPTDDSVPRLIAEIARTLSPRGVFVAEVTRSEYLATLAEAGDEKRSVRPDGDDGFVHIDQVTGAKIHGRVFSMQRWEDWLRPHFEPKVSPLGAVEALVFGQMRADG